MIANWEVPEGDRGDLVYLGSKEGHDLYFSPSHKEIVLRFGDHGPDYTAMGLHGGFWSIVESGKHPKSQLYRLARKRATMAGIL